MTTGRRLTVLLLALLLIGAPAIVLNLACAGESCQTTSVAKAEVPFCPLPADLRGLLENGFYKGRSPDVFSVAKDANVRGGTGALASDAAPTWPYPGQVSDTSVPIIVLGDGVTSGYKVPDGTGIDQIAPTLAAIDGLDRGHPEVRAGTEIDGAWKRASPRLILMIGIKGLGGTSYRRWPYLTTLMKQGAGTFAGSTQSLPVDAAASLATLGTGGLPSQHGITGSLLRNGTGKLTPAWGSSAPHSVISTLADDLDYKRGNEPFVGMVATDARDRGLIGDGWYTLGTDTDPFVVARPAAVADAVGAMLGKDFGHDGTTDLIGVTLNGSLPSATEAQLQAIVQAATAASGGSLTIAIAGTGRSAGQGKDAVTARSVVQQVQEDVGAPVVETAVPGGLFLDQQVLSDKGLPAGKAVDALAKVTDTKSDQPLMLDAYPAFSISFARYCGR